MFRKNFPHRRLARHEEGLVRNTTYRSLSPEDRLELVNKRAGPEQCKRERQKLFRELLQQHQD